MSEKVRQVTEEYAVEVTHPSGEIIISPVASYAHAVSELERVTAPPLLGDPLEGRILSRTKTVVINVTTWEAYKK